MRMEMPAQDARSIIRSRITKRDGDGVYPRYEKIADIFEFYEGVFQRLFYDSLWFLALGCVLFIDGIFLVYYALKVGRPPKLAVDRA